MMLLLVRLLLILLGRLRLLRPRTILGEQALPLAWLTAGVWPSSLHRLLLLELLGLLLRWALLLLKGLLLLLHHAGITLHPRIAALLRRRTPLLLL